MSNTSTTAAPSSVGNAAPSSVGAVSRDRVAKDWPQLRTLYPLSTKQIESFRRDGFIVLRNVLGHEEVAALRQVIWEELGPQVRNVPSMAGRDTYGKAFVQIMHLWSVCPAMREFSLARRFGGIVADLFGVDAVRINHDQLLFKEAGGGYTPLHQDQYYIPLDTANVLTMWLPLVDVTPEMGTLKFVPGSQAAGDKSVAPTSDTVDGHYQKIVTDRGWGVVDTGPMAAGDASFHLGWTIHGGGANTTDRMREVFNNVYFADGAKIVARGAWQGSCHSHFGRKQPGEAADSDVNPVVFRR